jgi:HEPN domain-containing protein
MPVPRFGQGIGLNRWHGCRRIWIARVATVLKSPTRKDLQELSRLRLQEAEALYRARLYDGCVYLAGYAVELALKARICRLLRVEEYPPLSGEIGRAFKAHSLEQLMVLAGLSREFDTNKNQELFDNWSRAIVWYPEQRYEAPGKFDGTTAKAILDSLTAKPNGVITWLSKRW